MYNLIMTAEDGAWERGRYSLPIDRFGEYTAEPIKKRYRNGRQLSHTAELQSFPTLLAYEKQNEAPARLASLTKIYHTSRPEVRFEYRIIDHIDPIPFEMLDTHAWELDLGKLEMNRTHWAVKDIDLLQVLTDAGINLSRDFEDNFSTSSATAIREEYTIQVTPKAFSVPEQDRYSDLVSVMMPFEAAFDPIYEAIADSCSQAGLRCKRVDDLWEESTIIQEVFRLIYLSRIVVVDLTNKNANVLYETGIAHTLGREVVPIAQDVESIPFDLVHHRVLEYLPNDEGLRSMKQKLTRRLRNLSSVD